MTSGLRLARAAYTAAVFPAQPDPTIMTSSITASFFGLGYLGTFNVAWAPSEVGGGRYGRDEPNQRSDRAGTGYEGPLCAPLPQQSPGGMGLPCGQVLGWPKKVQ